jgi:hypothetical protein
VTTPRGEQQSVQRPRPLNAQLATSTDPHMTDLFQHANALQVLALEAPQHFMAILRQTQRLANAIRRRRKPSA